MKLIIIFQGMVFKSANLKCRSLFETLMAKLTPKSSANYKDEIVQSLVACLIKDPQCFSVWKTLYSKNLYQSDLLLKNISKLFAIFLINLLIKFSLALISVINYF